MIRFARSLVGSPAGNYLQNFLKYFNLIKMDKFNQRYHSSDNVNYNYNYANYKNCIITL